MNGSGGLQHLVVGVALAVALSACGNDVRPAPATAVAPTGTPSPQIAATPAPTFAGPTPACPYHMDWPPYHAVGVPSGLTVTRTGQSSVRVTNTTSGDWTVRGEWWEWGPCWGVGAYPGDPVSLPAGSSTDLAIKDPGFDWPPPHPAPTRIGVAFWDHPCTGETCVDQPTGFWWIEIPTPSPSGDQSGTPQPPQGHVDYGRALFMVPAGGKGIQYWVGLVDPTDRVGPDKAIP